MQTQIAFYDCFYFYVQPVNFTAIISEKFRMRKYHFREFPLQIWQKLIVYKIWIDREKARRDKKGMKRKGFFLFTIRISLSNSTIIYLLQPIRFAQISGLRREKESKRLELSQRFRAWEVTKAGNSIETKQYLVECKQKLRTLLFLLEKEKQRMQSSKHSTLFVVTKVRLWEEMRKWMAVFDIGKSLADPFSPNKSMTHLRIFYIRPQKLLWVVFLNNT